VNHHVVIHLDRLRLAALLDTPRIDTEVHLWQGPENGLFIQRMATRRIWLQHIELLR
jgi:hypothetical protein